MKQIILLSAVGALASSFASGAAAEEVGRVISSTPVIQQVAVPRQVCNTQPAVVQQPSSGGGALVGAIVGGLLGNTIGHGAGRFAATGVGAIAGAAVGDSIEGRSAYAQPVQQCSTQTWYENRTVGYNIQYEYAGKQYGVQLPYDPGPTIRLQLTPVGAAGAMPDTAGMPGPAGAAPVIVAPPMVQGEAAGQPVARIIATPTPVAYPAEYATAYGEPAYQTYYQPYYRAPVFYPPIGLSLNFGYSGHRHGHRHWR